MHPIITTGTLPLSLSVYVINSLRMIKIILPTLILLFMAVVAMGVKALFVKGGKFPSGHAHDIPALRKKGIGCAHSDD